MLFGPTIVFSAGTGDYRLGIPYHCNSSVLLYFFLFISHWFLFSRRECIVHVMVPLLFVESLHLPV